MRISRPQHLDEGQMRRGGRGGEEGRGEKRGEKRREESRGGGGEEETGIGKRKWNEGKTTFESGGKG